MRMSFTRGRKKEDSWCDPTITPQFIKELEGVLKEKDQAVDALQTEVKRLREEVQKQMKEVRRRHDVSPVVHVVSDKGTSTSPLNGKSFRTVAVISEMPSPKEKDHITTRIIDMFKHPDQHTDYLRSDAFARDLDGLCQQVSEIFEEEPRCLLLQSPVYVFGDIHGNLEDLNFFSDNMWPLGMTLTAGRFLFLGDYVDRGMMGLECLAYLFALKIENPDKLFMLRGNHELKDVNGWIEHYGKQSFLWQCQNRFGLELGQQVWETCNDVFDRLPLAAVIDHDIFCVHGGIPRPLPGSTSRLQDIMCVPSVAGVCPANDQESFESQQVASDCMWSDPARDEQEMVLDEFGFGESLRGGGAICFGSKAIDDFLKQGNLSYIMRAHEAHSEGVSVSKNAKVFTVFSTSKDHGQGKGAMCGCILVDFERLLVINRSTKYKNRYVHRRDSVSLLNVGQAQLDKMVEQGLVYPTEVQSDSDFGDDAHDQDEFDGFTDYDVEDAHYSSGDDEKKEGGNRRKK